MKTILKIFLTIFLVSNILNADSIKEEFEVDGYKVEISTKKELSKGNNDFIAKIKKDGVEIKDAQIKIKFFMPEMPGMAYMEYEDTGVLKKDEYNFKINLSMSGTWQYHIKFKTNDEKTHSIKNSLSF